MEGTTYIASSSINTKDVNGRVRRYLTKGDIEVFDNAENFVHDDDELVDSWKQNMGVDSKRLRLEWAMTFFNMLQILRFSLALRDNQLRVIFDTVDQMKKVVEHQNEAWSNLDPLEALWRGEITCQKQLLYELIASVVHGAEVRPYCKVLNMLCHCRYYHINFLWDTMYADQLFIGLVSPSYVGAFPIRFINIWDNTISSQPFIEFVNRHTKIISGRHSRWSALTIYHPTWIRQQENEAMYDAVARFFQKLDPIFRQPIADEHIRIPLFFSNTLFDRPVSTSSKRQRTYEEEGPTATSSSSWSESNTQ